MRHVRISRLALAAVTLLGACSAPQPGAAPSTSEPLATASSSPAPTATPHLVTVSGVVGLGHGATLQNFPTDGQCSAISVYTDIQEGSQVKITDSSGAVVALGALAAGVPIGDGDLKGCGWFFTALAPTAGSFYQATVLGWSSDLVAEADLPTTRLLVLPAG